MTAGMHLPEVVSPEEWLAARRELPAKEKKLTRISWQVDEAGMYGLSVPRTFCIFRKRASYPF
jgi:predicted dithiol-disulfide oxidoreductase (DUF899 family)